MLAVRVGVELLSDARLLPILVALGIVRIARHLIQMPCLQFWPGSARYPSRVLQFAGDIAPDSRLSTRSARQSGMTLVPAW